MKSKIEEMIKDSGVKLFSDRQLLKEALGIINQSLAGGDFHFGNLSTTLEEIRRRTEGVKMPDLNSQDQEEERKLQVEMQDEYPVSHGDEEIKDRRKPHDFRPYYENEEFEDTPEQTESDVQEWEEEWHSTPVYNQISFIKNLLEEREDRAREEVMFTEDEQRVLRFALKLQRDDTHKVWDEETFGTIWKKVGGLSKLTTK